MENTPHQQQVNSNTIPQIVEIELKSERGIDYSQLRDFLVVGKWKEADEETAKVMYRIAVRSDKQYARKEDIDNFPSEDLQTINQLWLHYSNGKFGFSVQKEIYESLGDTSRVWIKFCERVGWRMKKKWLSYENLFDNQWIENEGHLPAVAPLWLFGLINAWDILPSCQAIPGCLFSCLGLLFSQYCKNNYQFQYESLFLNH